MASIWKLPVLFICENNQFATEVPFALFQRHPRRRPPRRGVRHARRRTSTATMCSRFTRRAAKRSSARVPAAAPTLIECKTYRTRAHAEGMGDFTYRTREEVDEWKERCPIQTFRETAGRNELGVPVAELEAIDDEVAALVAEARSSREASRLARRQRRRRRTSTRVPRSARQTRPPADAASAKSRYVAATLEALERRNGRATDSIFVMGEGIGVRGGNFRTTTGLFDKYGAERLCDTPICERGFVGLACGAAMTGTRPVIDFMFADFILDGFGEIVNQIAKMQYMSSGRLKMPVLLRGCIGIGHSAATHHSGSYYAHVRPGARACGSSCLRRLTTPRDSCCTRCGAMIR